jgi:PilZ domain
MTEIWQRAFVPQQTGRRTERKDMVFMAQLRESGAGSGKFSVTIKDISVTGFRCETNFALRPGSRVWLTIPNLSSLESIVIWRNDFIYGCKFAAPLHIAVLDHLAQRALI